MDDNFFERNNVRCDRCGATHPAPDNAPPPHWAFVMINFPHGAGSSPERDRSHETPTSLSHQFFRDDLEGGDALLLCDRCLASLVEWYRCMRSAPEWYRDMRSAP